MAQRQRKNRDTPQQKKGVPAYIWVLLVLLAGAVIIRVAPNLGGSLHPEPREGITSAFVVDAERYAAEPQIAQVYTMAKAIPNVLDGLFCYCACARNFGHRSLLTCFESDHGAGCDVCLQEAALAHRMTQDGATLDQIRAQIDQTWGVG